MYLGPHHIEPASWSTVDLLGSGWPMVDSLPSLQLAANAPVVSAKGYEDSTLGKPLRRCNGQSVYPVDWHDRQVPCTAVGSIALIE